MQPSQIDSEKAILRRRFLALRYELNPNDRKRWDERLLRLLTECEAYRRCRILLAYYPIRGEIDVLPMVRRAYADGKLVAFPVSNPTDHTLIFRGVSSLAELSDGTYRIPEPPSHLSPVCTFTEALCLVPALSFAPNGFRLGYGGGFYDRFLAEFDGCSVGLTYEVLVSRSLPHHINDRPVQLIFTEKGEVR